MKEIRKTTVGELKKICDKMEHPDVDYNVIIPGIILGGITTAKNTKLLNTLKVTHIMNTAYDKTGKGNFIYVAVNEDFYTKRDFDCQYLGIRAMDTCRFKIDKYFDEAVKFIDDALNEKGVCFIHCYMGISRSAVIIVAYLMLKKHMQLVDAVKFVRNKRKIFPNDGFFEQLIQLEERERVKEIGV